VDRLGPEEMGRTTVLASNLAENVTLYLSFDKTDYWIAKKSRIKMLNK
jgi:hypothetical protein